MSETPQLARRLGAFDATMIVMGGIIGSGIFMNPYVVARQVHTPALIIGAWVAGGVIALLGAFAYAELAALRPDVGGQYAYLRDAYHPSVAFLYGWALLLIVQSGGMAAVAVTFARYAIELTGSPMPPAVVAVITLAALTMVNCFGVRSGSNTQTVLMLLKLAAILMLIFFGIWTAPASVNSQPPTVSHFDWLKFGAAMTPVMFAYGGWQTASFISGELKRPRRDLALGLLVGVIGVIAVYVGVNIVCVRVLGAAGLAETTAPASAVMRLALGERGARLIAAGIAVSTLGFLSQSMLTAPRVYYAMAADGVFFRAVAKIHPETRVPIVAIILQGAVAVVITLSGTYEQILGYVVSTDFIFFGLTGLALFIFRRRSVPHPRPPCHHRPLRPRLLGDRRRHRHPRAARQRHRLRHPRRGAGGVRRLARMAYSSRLNRADILTRLSRASGLALGAGAALGAIAVFAFAPDLRWLFDVPGGGVGLVTVTKYPKGFDYFVAIALIVVSAACSALVAVLTSRARRVAARPAPPPVLAARSRAFAVAGGIVVFAAMLLAHDHPHAFMDMFHEGEHLTPGGMMREGGRPYRDIFFLHGFAVDGGIDALTLGAPPSPMRARRMETLLNALTLAMLVPIAAELSTSLAGGIVAAIVGLAAVGAGLVPAFPWFRLAPLLVSAWGLLVHVRRRNRASIIAATLAATLGVLWSLEVGLYTFAGAAAVLAGLCIIARRDFTRAVVKYGLIALVAPLVVLLLARADVVRFARDSFVIIPSAIDATWSLPARPMPSLAKFDWEAARYYFPPVFFGFLIVLGAREAARRHREAALRIFIVAAMSVFVFRTAAGRCSWSHTRFAVPLLGVAFIAFVVEPAIRSMKFGGAWWRAPLLALLLVPAWRYFEVDANAVSTWKFVKEFRSRLVPQVGQVPMPLPRARGVYTYPQEAADLAALAQLAAALPPGPIFDLSGERALYYLLDRRPATRCPDIAMLSAPRLTSEALGQLEQNPPVFVVVEGLQVLGSLDGVHNRDRVPAIAAWVDAHYPVRQQVGRYVVALK